MEKLVVILTLAFLSESLVEYFLAEWVGKWAKYAAAGVGVLLALNFQVDVFASFLGLKSLHPVIGYILTGLLLGRGANFLNDFADMYLRPPVIPEILESEPEHIGMK